MIPKENYPIIFKNTKFDYNEVLLPKPTKTLISFDEDVLSSGSMGQQLPPALGDYPRPIKGTSVIIEPDVIIVPLPKKDAVAFKLDNPKGGFPIKGSTTNVNYSAMPTYVPSVSGGSASDVVEPVKNKFPYWLIAVAVVGGYFVFRKK